MYKYAEDYATMGFVLDEKMTEKLIDISNFYEKAPYETIVMLLEMTHTMVVNKKGK